jgi:hypothetical protein
VIWCNILWWNKFPTLCLPLYFLCWQQLLLSVLLPPIWLPLLCSSGCSSACWSQVIQDLLTQPGLWEWCQAAFKSSQLSLNSELLVSFLCAPLVATIKTEPNGFSSSCITCNRNNFCQRKYKSNPKRSSKQATKSSQVIADLRPLLNSNDICSLSTHPSLPEALPTLNKPSLHLVCTPGDFVTALLKTTCLPRRQTTASFFWMSHPSFASH